MILSRSLKIPTRSFFLFGPRGAGKSTWLRQVFPSAVRFDLLESGLYLELTREPQRLEALAGKLRKGSWIIIDEIQRIPDLLNEVHRLMELHQWRFALCGSSARKLRRGGVNLLGGRAVTCHMEAFSSAEIGKSFNWEFALQWGTLPAIQTDRRNAADILNSYVQTYVQQEIREEGIVRSLPPFLRFLSVAGLLNGNLLNAQNVARDASVPRSSVDSYFSILEDSLLSHRLPAYRPRMKVREQAHPKFYWFDPGVARSAAGLLFDPVDRSWKGLAMETLIFHELRVFNQVSGKNRLIAYYGLPSGSEIDFVIELRKARDASTPQIVCIEAKLADRWNRKWEKPMRSLTYTKGIHVKRMIGVYTGLRTYHFDGVDVLPLSQFLVQLHTGRVF